MVVSPDWGAVKIFDLLQNPLFLFKLEPTASLEKIADAYEDAVADQIAPEPALASAREALVNPRQRLAAELSYLLDTPSGQLRVIYAALKERTSSDRLCTAADRLAPLSKANLLAHVGAQGPSKDDLLFALVDAHSSIKADVIHSKLRSTRDTAGFVVPSIDSVSEQLHELIALHARAVIRAYPAAKDAADPLGRCTKRVLISADNDRVDALEGLVRAFGQAISPNLDRVEGEIKESAELLRANPQNISLVRPIADLLGKWMSLACPLVEFEAHKGRDEPRARQQFVEIRSLAIDLANNHNSFQVALTISNVAVEVFKSLPRAVEQLNEDLPLLEERTAESHVIPLRAKLDKLSRWVLVSDLISGGFGPSSVGIAKELWTLFCDAAKKSQNSVAADLPWFLLRGLAVDINNDENSPVAAKAMLEGLLNQTLNDLRPSKEVLEKLHEDLRTCRRNIREKQLIEDINANRLSPALSGVYELLSDPGLLKEQRDSLNKLRDQLERKRIGRYVKWGAAAVVGAIIVIANMPDKSPPSTTRPEPWRDRTASSYPPRNDNPPGIDYSPKVDYPPKSSIPPQPEALVETKPPVGSGNIFSQTSIRYCRYQKERLRIVGQDLRNDGEVQAFNGLVEDYNARCSEFRYREGDLQKVTDELRSKSETLAAEARSILQSWRLRSPPNNAAVAPSPTPYPSFPRADATLPQPKQSGEPSFVTAPPQADPSLELLQLEPTVKVQKRLIELGYFRGPANGTWGPQSRSSLRGFKAANGLNDNDAFDDATRARLFSPSASRASSSKAPTSQPVSQETSYAPPVGTTLNPLNRSDASKIHAKLRELGLYRANSLTLWSAASRDALRDFKARNQLDSNDVWDAQTEERLMSATLPLGSDSQQEAFAAAIGGLWTSDIRACPGGTGGSDASVVTIGPKGAETEGARCDFASISGAGTAWRTSGVCNANGAVWRANISLTRNGDALVWASEKGTIKYLKCPT